MAAFYNVYLQLGQQEGPDHGLSQEKAEQEEKDGTTVGNSGGTSVDLCASESYCVCLGWESGSLTETQTHSIPFATCPPLQSHSRHH